MSIDAHVHIDGAMQFPESLLTLADHYQVEKLCVSSLARGWPRNPTPEQVTEANDAVRDLMAKHPDRIIGFCYVNPLHTDHALAEMDRRIDSDGFLGVKLWVSCFADDPCVYPVIEKAIDLSVVVLQHAWFNRLRPAVTESTPHHVANLARRYPEAKLFMAHSGGDWERGLRAIRDATTLHTDVCGSDNYTGMVEMAVRELGADRVIWGTDCPGRSMASQIGKVLGADISDEDKEKILGRNITRLLQRN